MSKCKLCGKEITRTDRKYFCCQECSYQYKTIKNNFKRNIERIAKKYGFELQNVDKIVNAKMMIFVSHDENVKKCPCDPQNHNRFCGSAQCIADVVYKGHCHCSLFWLKNKSDDIK